MLRRVSAARGCLEERRAPERDRRGERRADNGGKKISGGGFNRWVGFWAF